MILATWLTSSCFLAFGLLIVILIVVLSAKQRLRSERDAMQQEKDMIYGFINDVGEVFGNVERTDTDLLLKRVLVYALRATRAGAGAAYLLEPDDEHLRARAISGVFPPLSGELDRGLERTLGKAQQIESLVRSRVLRLGEGLIGQVAASGIPLLIEDAGMDPRIPKFSLDFLTVRSLLLVPMRMHQTPMGVLAVVNRVDGQPFIQADLNLLQALADQASISVHFSSLRETLEGKQRIDHDLQVARGIQTGLLPKAIPAVPGTELAAFYTPAMEIGGDYYDFFPVDDRHLGIAVADVSGKGIAGAIMMSVCRSVLRAQAPGNRSPAVVLQALNRVISPDMAENMFASVLYMVLDTQEHRLTVARAGHERPILCSGDGQKIRLIDSPGIAIGLADASIFDEAIGEVTVPLNPGDVVVAYTDGITEAMNPAGAEWGLEAFLDTISRAAAGGAANVLDHVRQRQTRFVGNQPQYDDTTLVALRRRS